jgi:hypothetical protein
VSACLLNSFREFDDGNLGAGSGVVRFADGAGRGRQEVGLSDVIDVNEIAGCAPSPPTVIGSSFRACSGKMGMTSAKSTGVGLFLCSDGGRRALATKHSITEVDQEHI